MHVDMGVLSPSKLTERAITSHTSCTIKIRSPIQQQGLTVSRTSKICEVVLGRQYRLVVIGHTEVRRVYDCHQGGHNGWGNGKNPTKWYCNLHYLQRRKWKSGQFIKPAVYCGGWRVTSCCERNRLGPRQMKITCAWIEIWEMMKSKLWYCNTFPWAYVLIEPIEVFEQQELITPKFFWLGISHYKFCGYINLLNCISN